MNLYLVRLHFNGPLHVGHDEAGIGVEAVLPYLHSDTIFSAFCNAWSSCDEGRYYLDKIEEKKVPVHLSSAFFYHGSHTGSGTDYTYFLPRPLIPFPARFGPLAKTVKSTEFITLDQFSDWIEGKITKFSSAQIKGIGAKKYNYKDLYTMQVRARHAQDRQTMASSIYHSGEVFFRGRPKEGGLYFLAFAESKEALVIALNILQQSGFGGIRSAGYGKYDYDLEGPLSEESDFGSIFLNKGSSTNAYCLLSLCYPASDELNQNSFLAYRTIMRKGWFSSAEKGLSFKRKSCYMISEGSVLKEKPEGVNLDLRPKGFNTHPVYRCGLAMSVPLQLSEDNDRKEETI